MKFARSTPGCGYRGTWLWLPRSQVSSQQLRSALSFDDPRARKAITAWADYPDHILVPRNYQMQETLRNHPFPVYSTLPQGYPRVHLRSRVILDAKEPSKSYQHEAAQALLRTEDGILCLRCGAGKTVVVLHAAAQLHVPILVIVNELGLAAQWLEEIERFLGVPPSKVGFVGGGKFDWERDITIAVVHTLASRAKDHCLPLEMRLHFGVVIPDEAHVMGAPYFNLAIPPFPGRRWGLTATPTRGDQYDSLLEYTIGRVVYTYLFPDLQPRVEFRTLPTDSRNIPYREIHDRTGEFHFGLAYNYLATLPARTDRIVADIYAAMADGRQCLVLTHSRRMCELLGECIPEAGVVHGGVTGACRRSRINAQNPVVSVMALGKQALNKPSLDTLFVVEPLAKSNGIQQIMGRILRKFSGKQSPLVVFYDDMNIPPLHNLCNKVRRTLTSWPAEKGGRVPYTTV